MTDILTKHGITFDESKHAYTSKAGFPLPSVTQILPFKCDGPEDVIRKAAERGHRVHKWIETQETYPPGAQFFPPMFVMEPSDRPYCDAWLKFKEITGFELARLPTTNLKGLGVLINEGRTTTLDLSQTQPMVERFIYHPIYQFVGRLDLIGYLRRIPGIENDLTLVDAKTVQRVYPTTALQCSAYREAINLELKKLGLPLVKHSWAAQLRPDGTCRREAYKNHAADFSVFLSYLNVTRWETSVGMATLPEDPFVHPEIADREVEEVMARL